MKILHINSYYNGSMFYKNLYDKQVESGLDINVFVPTYKPIKPSLDFGNYTVISCNHNKYDRFIYRLKQNKIYTDLINKIDVIDYSLIHAHSLFTNGYVAMKIKKEFNIPYIVAVRNTDVNIFFKRMIHLRRIGIEILKNAEHVVFLSKPYRDQTIAFLPKKIKNIVFEKSSIIPNGIDDFWLENKGEMKTLLSRTDINLLQIGDINKNKNIDMSVKVVNLLISDGYNVKLDVVGRIRDQKVFDRISSLKFVNYLGYLPKEELIKVYKNNDIFILPSINETFGLVYAEAISQGLPVIYTKGQGFDSQFKDGVVGFSVNWFDEDEIKDKIINLIINYKHISKNCIEMCNKFSWSNIFSLYNSIYKRWEKNK